MTSVSINKSPASNKSLQRDASTACFSSFFGFFILYAVRSARLKSGVRKPLANLSIQAQILFVEALFFPPVREARRRNFAGCLFHLPKSLSY